MPPTARRSMKSEGQGRGGSAPLVGIGATEYSQVLRIVSEPLMSPELPRGPGSHPRLPTSPCGLGGKHSWGTALHLLPLQHAPKPQLQGGSLVAEQCQVPSQWKNLAVSFSQGRGCTGPSRCQECYSSCSAVPTPLVRTLWPRPQYSPQIQPGKGSGGELVLRPTLSALAFICL